MGRIIGIILLAGLFLCTFVAVPVYETSTVMAYLPSPADFFKEIHWLLPIMATVTTVAGIFILVLHPGPARYLMILLFLFVCFLGAMLAHLTRLQIQDSKKVWRGECKTTKLHTETENPYVEMTCGNGERAEVGVPHTVYPFLFTLQCDKSALGNFDCEPPASQ